MIAIRKHLKDPRIFIFLAPLILFSPLYLTGKALYWGTPSTQFVPWWDFVWRSVLSGQTPLWNPFLGMGAPLAANYQTALFYPPTWIYFIAHLMGGVKLMSWTISLVVCGHLIWSGLGTAAILQDLKVNKIGQTIGGLAFSLSGYLVARAGFLSINATAAWIPWLLLYLYRISKRAPGSWLKLTAVTSMLLLAGHAQTAWHALLLGGCWAVYWGLANSENRRRLSDLGRTMAGYLGAGISAMAISAVQLLPTAEYLLLSQRAGEYGFENAMTYSFWPWRFLTFLLPDLFGNPATGLYWGYGNFWEDAVYIGLLPLLLAMGYLIRSLVRKEGTEKAVKEKMNPNPGLFLGVITLISFLLALGDNTGLFPFLYNNIPGMDLFQAPTRYTIWGEISLALLAGLGANEISKLAGKRLYVTRLAVAGCISIVAGAVLAGLYLDDIRVSFIYSAGRVGLIGCLAAILFLAMPERKDNRKNQVWGILVLCLVCFDLINAGWGLNPGIEMGFYDVPDTKAVEGRVWMPSDVEYNLKFKEFFRFDTFEPGVNWDDMHQVFLPNLPMLHGRSMVNNFDPIVPAYYQEWMDAINAEYPAGNIMEMMNISSVIKNGQAQEVEGISLSYAANPLKVTGCLDVVNPDNQDPGLILNHESGLLDDIIVFSDEKISCFPGGTGQIQILEKKNGYLELIANLDKDGWIFWSQTWYPGWQFKIDGRNEGETYRVNYLFQGVPIDQGTHQVELIYRPASIIWGSIISGLGLTLVIVISITRKKLVPS